MATRRMLSTSNRILILVGVRWPGAALLLGLATYRSNLARCNKAVPGHRTPKWLSGISNFHTASHHVPRTRKLFEFLLRSEVSQHNNATANQCPINFGCSWFTAKARCNRNSVGFFTRYISTIVLLVRLSASRNKLFPHPCNVRIDDLFLCFRKLLLRNSPFVCEHTNLDV